MKRTIAAVLVVAAAFVTAGASASGTATVHALVWEKNTLSLATLDATTLAPRARPLALGRAQGEVFTDSLGERLAVASAGAGIVIVDTRRMGVLWRLPRGRLVRAVSWLSPTRLLVVEHGGVLLLDPLRKRIVARSDFDGVVLASAKWSNGLVLLAFRNEGSIEPARLFVVGPGVGVRTTELSRIAAGWASASTSEGDVNSAQPALAVDAVGGRAFVAGGPHLATIDLASLSVSYVGSERTLQKWASGPRRSAAWLGDGVLAVAGADEKWTGAGTTSTPFGLRYVSSSGVRVIDENATLVNAAGGLALAYGNRYTNGGTEGIGLIAYDRAGAFRWRLFDDTPISSLTVAGNRAYVWAGRRLQVVDLVAGAVIGGTDVPRTRWLQIIG
ncbi:MAG: hypothetical protein M5U27_01240 [Gaiella sp.]|nr:hypothetical protein [Gaiella sp.]